MTTINLRTLFPSCELDCFVEVPDGDVESFKASLTEEVAAVYFDGQRKENAYQRRVYRNKAHFSLDQEDGIENDAVFTTSDPFEIFADKLAKQQIYDAMNLLPEKQRRRIHSQYFLGMSRSEIARAEGVDVSTVRESITAGLLKLKKILEKLL